MGAVWWLWLLTAGAPANIFPDGDFEQGGTAGEARSGQKAGHLTVADQQHWIPLGGDLATEPFATYRAVAWAKAHVERGAAIALYAYAWDSYVWAFSSQAPVPNGGDWQRFETTFISPYATIVLHPAALLDAAHGEIWVDDVVVERIASPAETIARLEAKPALTADEARVLARWHAGAGRLDEAWSVAARTDDARARADIACVVAKATDEPRRRTAMLAEMILNGAAGYNDGLKRIGEVAATLDPAGTIEALAAAVARRLDDPAAIAGFAGYARGVITSGDPLGTVRERRDRLTRLAAACRGLTAAAGDQPDLRAVAAALSDAEKALEQQMAHLGSCRVSIDGKPLEAAGWAIVLPTEPTAPEATAARDLRAHLEKICGEAPAIVGPGELAGRQGIFIGRASADDVTGLGAEGYSLRTAADGLHLTGGAPRGTLYAVYVLLEDHLGCRWFTPDCATWPTTGTIAVGPLAIREVPKLEYRATDYPKSRPPEFAVRNRYNGTQIAAGPEWGGKVSYKGFVHTFNALVPPERYFAEHPEYFSEVNGQRLRDYSQLCLTNPDVLRIATESVRRWIAEDPEATIISVSQNDWHGYCQCAKCAAVADAEGSQSGPLLHFVNAIAEAIEVDHPNIIIDTLAYQYTRKPPRQVKPRPNVAIRLCSIECEFNRPLDTSPYNATFVDDIRGWNAICDRLHIWDYVINYAHCVQPFPNLRVLQPNIRFFLDNGVTGIYEEANYFSHGGENAELRTWLMAKLLWNPEFDVEAGIDEFLAAYYGPAAEPIRRYLDDLHDLAVSDPNYHMPIYVPPTAPFQSAEALARYEALFDAAEAAVAGDPERLHRVQVARLPILYTRIAQSGGQAYRRQPDALVPSVESDYTADLGRFEAIARAEGLTAVSENQGWGAFETWLAARRSSGVTWPLVTLRGGGLEAQVLPGVGGRLFSLRWADDGRELLQIEESPGGIDPLVGGYKEFSTLRYQSAGWSEPYEVVSQSSRAVTVRAKLPTGVTLERTYELAGDQPLLRIRSTLTNTSGEPRTGCVRVHACFRLDDPTRATLTVGGTEYPLPLAQQTWGERTFSGQARPAGEWSLFDPLGRTQITSRFPADGVATCYLNYSSEDRRGNLELWPDEVTLAPGQSVTLAHEYAFARRY